MKKERIKAKVADLIMNEGQLGWLPTNPRQWTREDVEKTKASLENDADFTEERPVLVVACDGKLLVFAGNLRTTAARALKWEYISAVLYTPENDEDKDTIKRRSILDNGAFGSWDYDMLANEWDDLPLSDWGVPAWSTEDVELESVSAKDVQEDDFDEEKDHIEVRCKRGDVWQLGEHRLMCGESVSLEDVKKLMGGAEADLWLTDPPYNVNYEGGTEDKLKIENDNMSDSDFRAFLVGAYSAADGVMRPGAVFYIWHADSEGANFRGAAKDVGWKVRECLIWNKNSMVLGRQDYQWKHEPCLYGWKEGAGHSWYSDRKQTTVLDFDRPTRNGEHPTMKPLALFAYQMQNSTKVGDVVLDSFGGSGTTLIVAEQTGRKARVMELDPHYCDVIIARWEKATGKEAVLCEE